MRVETCRKFHKAVTEGMVAGKREAAESRKSYLGKTARFGIVNHAK